MSNGMKSIVINTQERAVSADINRLQAFKAADIAEYFRYEADAFANDDLDAAAVITEPNAIETPLRAEITNGLLVRPQPASLNLLVDPGVVYLMAPDGGADDSNYKYVRDAGVSALGSLVVLANGAGSARIDVVECQRNATDVVVTDSRDIFNPSTGLFSPASITKERSAQLTFRVRAGIAGGGFPGVVAGWLPLAVISAPAGSVAVDTMDFWDVRPLLSDRAFQPFSLSLARPRHGLSTMFNAVDTTAATGLIEVISGNRRLGGRLRSGSVVATDAESIDLTLAANREAGFALVAGVPWYLYLLTPFGLPRWARYNKTGSRVPRSPRGIPVVSLTSPNVDGVPSAAVALPTATGLAGSTTAGVCVGAGGIDAGSVFYGFYGDNHNGYMVTLGGEIVGPVGVRAANNIQYTLTAGTHFPRHARSLLLQFATSYTTGGAAFVDEGTELFTYAPNSAVTVIRSEKVMADNVDLTAAHTIRSEFTRWVPLAPTYPAVGSYTQKFQHFWTINGNTPDAVDTKLLILGWKF